VLFIDANVIQHVPKIWLKKVHDKKAAISGKKQLCWFPFTKADFPNTKVHFKSNQVHKMIRKCYVPNNTDGTWFTCKQIAGPFGWYNTLYIYNVLC